MNACASLGPIPRAGVLDDARPMVLIDDIPEPRLSVESFKVDGPLDVRSAVIRMDEPVGPGGVPQRWLNSEVTVAWPNRLNDDEVAWPVLLRGGLKQVEAVDSKNQHSRLFELSDLWGQVIAVALDSVWELNPDDSLIAQPQGSILIGLKANRSTDRFTVNGKQVFVIQQDSGLTWTVQAVLESLSAWADFDLVLTGLPRDIRTAELDDELDLAKPLGRLLEDLFDRFGLVIQRDVTRQGNSITESRVVRPVSSGRPIRVVWANHDRPLGDALKINVDRPAQPAQLWTARAEGWLVESTFELVGGWDPAFEGEDNDEYDEGLSSDFAAYADVYRNWVLNEDGFYSQIPYSRGAAYDLTSLFDAVSVDPQPLVFKANLTLDSDGEPVDPIVEMSTNSGADWSVFPKSSTMLKDRAGVYLNPKSLPTTFLDAAKLGNARLRVTASLRSPLPVELSRWRGNAFTAVQPPLVFDLSTTHRFQRVDAQSIHYVDIVTGSLSADEADDGYRLLDWLVKRLGRPTQNGRATLELAGAWPLLRVGDGLREVRGPGVATDGRAQALTRHGARVVGYETRFAGFSNNGGSTRIDLRF